MNIKKFVPMLSGAVLVLLGLPVLFGGAYLARLGGSWYYVLAGLLMIASGVALLRRKIVATWLALALLAITLAWSLFEVGVDFWQLVPRLIAFIVIALGLTLLAPWLDGDRRLLGAAPRAAISVVLAVALVGFFAGMFRPHPTVVAAQGASAPVVQPDAGKADGNDWTAYGRGTHGERFAQFDQINKDNVKDLKVAWTYRTGDMAVNGAEYQGTPLKVDDTVYLCTPFSKVFALDPVTGRKSGGSIRRRQKPTPTKTGNAVAVWRISTPTSSPARRWRR